jgi:hypothetical protein
MMDNNNEAGRHWPTACLPAGQWMRTPAEDVINTRRRFITGREVPWKLLHSRKFEFFKSINLTIEFKSLIIKNIFKKYINHFK